MRRRGRGRFLIPCIDEALAYTKRLTPCLKPCFCRCKYRSPGRTLFQVATVRFCDDRSRTSYKNITDEDQNISTTVWTQSFQWFHSQGETYWIRMSLQNLAYEGATGKCSQHCNIRRSSMLTSWFTIGVHSRISKSSIRSASRICCRKLSNVRPIAYQSSRLIHKCEILILFSCTDQQMRWRNSSEIRSDDTKSQALLLIKILKNHTKSRASSVVSAYPLGV